MHLALLRLLDAALQALEEALAATGRAMSRYLQGEPAALIATVENTTDTAGHFHPADSIGLYSEALKGVQLAAVLAGPVRPVVQAAVMEVDILSIIKTLLTSGKVSIPADLA